MKLIITIETEDDTDGVYDPTHIATCEQLKAKIYADSFYEVMNGIRDEIANKSIIKYLEEDR